MRLDATRKVDVTRNGNQAVISGEGHLAQVPVSEVK